jgi:hypothetical protein
MYVLSFSIIKVYSTQCYILEIFFFLIFGKNKIYIFGPLARHPQRPMWLRHYWQWIREAR